ncbi:cell division protein FtsK [Leptospira perolatii]|uniref:Cell division protein FtsK n=1 Tax=Leptospira perolatii TaxID=2023191 RepID=A0A2M9ZL15_9LEPT|nr:DNA translocase FtsK [Leptospira perolatii]PJZ70368.1 cell division protein FtsK [Leptospira perolatii]PJZ72748.1 cell division protein FtsK [Leptospira perolatii]
MNRTENEALKIWTWERSRAAFPYLLLFAGIFLTLSLGSFEFSETGIKANLFGRLGHFLSWGFFYLFGNASFVPGIMLLLTGGILLAKPNQDITPKILTIPLFLLAVAVSLNVFGNPSSVPFAANGGVLGQALAVAMEYLFGATGRLLLHFVIYFYGILVFINESPLHFLGRIMNQGTISIGDWKNQWTAGVNQARERSNVNSGSQVNPEKLGLETMSNFPKAMHMSWKENLSKFSDTFQSSAPEAVSESEIPPWFQKSKSERRESQLESYIQSEREKSSKVTKVLPSKKFVNSGLLEGFFEEERKIFRFQNAPASLVEKVHADKSEDLNRKSFAWEILDLRTKSDLSEELNLHKQSELPNYKASQTDSKTEIVQEDLRPVAFQADPKDLIEDFEDSNEVEEDSAFENIQLSEDGASLVESDTEEDIEEEDEDSIEDEREFEDVQKGSTLQVQSPKEVLSASDLKIAEQQIASRETEQKSKQENLPFPLVSMIPKFRSKRSVYHIPLNRLRSNPTKVQDALFKVESEKVAMEIQNALKVYGYDAKVVAWERGPIITRYELTPPPGVKLGRITSLTDELRMYLAVKNVRIVAPIPGKSTIGIEVPNKLREDVFLGDILRSSLTPKAKKDLNIVIGKDISGKLVSIDLNKLPHLLVAGTTGSGKSVCLNAMIASLVLHLSPEEVRFIMIDPKMVELTLFEDIPHLLMPVIKDARKATKALAWVIQEMEARYESVSQLKCRDFRSYNEKVEEHYHKEGYSKMPYVVVFIDELADLMMVSGKDLEDAITRISQKSRAVGIHLVMATQRPSVDVITGLIKANCPARIAFHVAQKMDSKIILDMNGAESLLGKGDMLYKSPTSADLARIQAPYISEEEIEKIVEEAKRFGAPNYVEMNFEEDSPSESMEEMDEELFEKSWEIVRTERKASASYLQRKLKIGYNRAARIMELMEERGYVSAILGSKGREILR